MVIIFSVIFLYAEHEVRTYSTVNEDLVITVWRLFC